MRHVPDLLKVGVFVTVTSLMSLLVALTFGNIKVQQTKDYSALFSDVSGLTKGVDVRASGVEVGTVSGLSLREDGLVKVDFAVAAEVPVTSMTEAQVRYANLTGDRYLDLTRGPATGGIPLAAGATIPESQTQPALDLDTLANGFQPLLRALSPADVNRLSSSIIQVAQGQHDAVRGLLANVASVSNYLADRDEVIGSVIKNLNVVLSTVADHAGNVEHLIDELERLVSGLANQREVLGASIVRVDRLAADTSNLLAEVRPGLRSTVHEAGRFAATINAKKAEINRVLVEYPRALDTLRRNGLYGSFFNFYLCGVRFKLSSDEATVPIYTPYAQSTEPRCVN